ELRLVARDLAIPVDRPPHALHLGTDPLDVLLDDETGVAALPDRRVLGVQAEGVVAHRPHDAPAAAPVEVREDVALGVVADLPDVRRPGWVRKQLLHLAPTVAAVQSRAMSDYTHINLKEDVDDQAPNFGLSPNLEARMARVPLELENAGVSYIRIAPGFRIPFGHKHKNQEEV